MYSVWGRRITFQMRWHCADTKIRLFTLCIRIPCDYSSDTQFDRHNRQLEAYKPVTGKQPVNNYQILTAYRNTLCKALDEAGLNKNNDYWYSLLKATNDHSFTNCVISNVTKAMSDTLRQVSANLQMKVEVFLTSGCQICEAGKMFGLTNGKSYTSFTRARVSTSIRFVQRINPRYLADHLCKANSVVYKSYCIYKIFTGEILPSENV